MGANDRMNCGRHLKAPSCPIGWLPLMPKYDYLWWKYGPPLYCFKIDDAGGKVLASVCYTNCRKLHRAADTFGPTIFDSEFWGDPATDAQGVEDAHPWGSRHLDYPRDVMKKVNVFTAWIGSEYNSGFLPSPRDGRNLIFQSGATAHSPVFFAAISGIGRDAIAMSTAKPLFLETGIEKIGVGTTSENRECMRGMQLVQEAVAVRESVIRCCGILIGLGFDEVYLDSVIRRPGETKQPTDDRLLLRPGPLSMWRWWWW